MPQVFQPIDCGRFTATGRTFFQSSPSTSASNCAWFSRTVAGPIRAAELRFLKRLGKQTHHRAIKPNRLGPARSFRTEYVERATEWISATVPHQSHQAGRTLAEVNRCARYINLHARRDHALR